jgi:hypothetical protein
VSRPLTIKSPHKFEMSYWNKKPQRKWQKSFITKVFARKTKRHDTYSKIIIDSPELLNDKNTHIPKKLFKFYAPTSDNIFDIKKQRLWLAHPSSFNDPFDCHTGYDVTSYEKFSILDHINKIGFINDTDLKKGFTEKDYNRIYNSSTEYASNWRKKIEEYSSAMHCISNDKNKEFKSEIYKLRTKFRGEAEEKINKLRDVNIRIACFSDLNHNNFPPKNNDFELMIQMWSHYADNHKGFCVEYDISSLDPKNLLPLTHKYPIDNQDEFLAERTILITAAGLFPVIYTADRVNIPITKLKKIKIDSNNKLQHSREIDSLLYKTFIVKSAKWNYENEWRIIVDSDICEYFENKLPFPYIKKLYLGCKMKTNHIDTLIEIADELNVEVILMKMDNKKFVLEEKNIDSYKWDKERSKWRNPLY